jgi:predicted glycosyltransferase
MSELEAADLVISMGGYNTICEILTLGKPAVVVPRALPVREQLIRAERMAGLGLIEMLHPDELSGVSLLEIVKRKLSEIRPQSGPDDRLNLNGIEHLANAIDELIPPETKAISAPSLTTETCAKCVSHDKSSLLETVVHVGASGARRRGNAA